MKLPYTRDVSGKWSIDKIMKACGFIEYDYGTLGLESRFYGNYFALLPMSFHAMLLKVEYVVYISSTI